MTLVCSYLESVQLRGFGLETKLDLLSGDLDFDGGEEISENGGLGVIGRCDRSHCSTPWERSNIK